VDDGSRDATPKMLRELADSRPGRIDLVEQRPNAGKAAAVRRGMLWALERSPSYLGYFDADLATPLELIPRFRELLEARPEIDVVMGARVALLGRSIERRATRHYVGRVAATAISLVLGMPVYDTQCGAKLFRATADVASLFEEPFATAWTFDVEILARLIRRRVGRGAPPAARAVYEYPLPEWRDVTGSKVRGVDYLRAALDLWRIHRRYLSDLPRSAASRGAGDPSPPGDSIR
jgi:dolichyl-phosphate beta-glucosyltransferase